MTTMTAMTTDAAGMLRAETVERPQPGPRSRLCTCNSSCDCSRSHSESLEDTLGTLSVQLHL